MSSINLPLILTIGVFVTGLIYLFDILFLAKSRKHALLVVEQEFTALEQTNTDLYKQKLNEAQSEPILVEYGKSFFPVLFVVFVLRSFIAEPFQIPSGSMEPTLDVGDFILVSKYAYGIRLPVLNKKVVHVNDPARGDVMVFFPPHLPDTYYIKRVIGLPGDKIEYLNHKLYINGELAPEKIQAVLPAGAPQYRLVEETIGEHSFTARKFLRPGRLSVKGAWRVPAGHYFMMGDNRDNSFDSRGWDDPFVPDENIVGKAVFVWMHWESFLSLPSFSTAGSIK